MGGRKVPEQERRESLLAAAATVAVTEGLEAVTARRVAAAADASSGLVFFHFGSKEGLLLALLDSILSRTLDATDRPELATLPAWERLYEMVRVEIEELPEQRGFVELLFAYYFIRRDELFRDPIDKALALYVEAFLPSCRDVAEETGAHAEHIATTVLSLIQGAAVQVIRAPASFDPESILSSLRAFKPIHSN